MRKPEHVNFGLAIDVQKPDGTRTLLVPSIKGAEAMDFAGFWAAYEDVVRRARNNKLTADDFAGTTISLTNPGTIGTVHSVPRLMAGQGTIIGVGAMEYPAEYQGAAPETLARLAVSKIMTLTSTYDHRIIQGAQSGDFLRRIHGLLLGEDGFYDEVFRALRIPYEPIRWVRDISASHEDDVAKQARVQELIHAYRVRGHLMADTDPLEFRQRVAPRPRRRHPRPDAVGPGPRVRHRRLRRQADGQRCARSSACCASPTAAASASSTCTSRTPRSGTGSRSGSRSASPSRTARTSCTILRRLNAAEAFETFLQTKYVGQKRFSLEGGESVIPLLDEVMTSAAESGLDEVTIGMPHRGRLNVLANLAGKSYAQIFREFEGNQDPRSVQGSGDVKYHLGTEGSFKAPDGSECKVYLAANPSHLEAVNPVLEGITRAKQDRIDKGEGGFTVLPVLLHGDAAFAGQGVVAETLNLSQLRGYRTGGTIHVIVNNQVGFTTSPAASRSSFYCTDVARMIQAPIFHVNGDDPEACVRVAKLAFEYRQEFKKDVVIDMVCYRRRGHNEGDDPSMTQPLMYALIENKRSVRKIYTESLIGRGDISVEEAEQALRDYQGQLERVFSETREAIASSADEGTGEGIEPAGRAEHVGRRRGPAHRRTPRGREADRRRARGAARRLHRAPQADAAAAAAGRDGVRGRHRLGDGRAVRVRVAAARGQADPDGRAGQPAGHLRPAARGAHRPGHRRRVGAAGAPGRGPGPVLDLRLAAVASSPRWASSTATRWPGRTRWCSGRRSSATSSTARRRSSTSSSRRRSRSGASARRSCCCCRTASRARGRTTRPVGSSGSCRCAPRTT